jgi:hypothetical protein
MTDELTPEEREALKSLPRERTPSAGLEDRVVAAMRQHGVLARKPARVIRITSTRVAGLLAACLVLMVGAYSIGLHRGVDNNVLKNIEASGSNVSGFSGREEDTGLKPPASEESVARQDAPMSIPLDIPESRARDEGTLKGDAPPLEWKLKSTQLMVPKDAKKQERRPRENEVNESAAGTSSDQLSSSATPPAPAARTAAPMQLQSKAATEGLMKRSRTFVLNGGTLIVDAPDSVRVVQDAQGRTLLIYTSDGIIRIRLAD